MRPSNGHRRPIIIEYVESVLDEEQGEHDDYSEDSFPTVDGHPPWEDTIEEDIEKKQVWPKRE